MGMTDCPECGHSVSDSARTCPSCGCVFSVYRKKKENEAGCCCLIIVIIVLVIMNEVRIRERRAEEARVLAEIGCNYIGQEYGSFSGMEKSFQSDDGRRFKMKLPLSDKNYYGLKAEQVSVVVAGNSQGAVDYQSVTFYGSNAAADKLFAELDGVLTSKCQVSGQSSQAAGGKTLVWKSDDLTYILQKNKADAPNRYLVILTGKKTP